MRFGEGGWHGKWVVEIGEGAGGKFFPRVEDVLRGGLDGGFLRSAEVLRPGEVVVNECCRVAVIALEPS